VRRVFPAGLSALFIVGLAALPVGAQDQADRLDLPGGWSPEGVTAIDGTLYAGSLGNGAIWTIDTAAEDIAGQRFAPGKKGRVTVGIEASPDGQTLWAAGGRTGAAQRLWWRCARKTRSARSLARPLWWRGARRRRAVVRS
jgi:hypothetical protein